MPVGQPTRSGAANEYQFSINGGSTYSSYTNGAAILTTAATTSVIVQSRRTGGNYGCSTTGWSTICTWPVSSATINPALNVATPVNGTSICAGYAPGATITAGSGGSSGAVDLYEYSINNGANWSVYTTGAAITTAGATVNVLIRASRSAGSYGCSATGPTIIVTWPVSAVPVAPTLGTASPSTGSTICAGFNTGTVNGTGGTGGSSGAANEYQFSINGGSTYSSYTNGAAILTTGATGSVIIQVRRTGGNYGCSTTAWSTICTWIVGSLSTDPTGVTITNNNTCNGVSKTLTVTGGSLGTGANWQWFTASCGGTSAGTGSSIVVDPAAGSNTIYYVRATGTCYTTGCATGTVAVTPDIDTPTTPAPSATTICQGSTNTAYTASSSNATSYNWTVTGTGNTISGTGTTGTVTWDAGYTGTATVRVTANGCNGPSAPASTTVTVRPTPAATIGGTTIVCQNDVNPMITFTNPLSLPVTITYNINGTNQSTINVGSNTSATIAAPTNTAGIFAYNLISVIYQSAPSCSNSITGTATVTVTEIPAATISYAGTPFCNTVNTWQPVTLNGSGAFVGGTFSAPAGLSINSTSGAIMPVTSTAGTYLVTYTIPASGGCGTATATTLVAITALPVATFSYTGNPYCSNGVNPMPAYGNGGVAGIFSSTAGLVFINTNTGQVNLAASTAGTYTVTNTISATGGCAQVTATNTITITTLPSAAITYPGSPFCQTLTVPQSVTLTGTTGGVFSSTPGGLNINPSTGDIIPSSSTAGTYTVTYTIAPANGCGTVIATTPVTITALPVATFNYAGNSFPTFIGGGTAGIFSSTTGLVFSSSATGQVNLPASTPGTYIVTNTIAASGGCGMVTATGSITITALHTVGFIWEGTPSSDWNNPNNWSTRVVPGLTSDVVIPDASTTLHDPVLPLTPAASVSTVNLENSGILEGGTATVLTLSGGTNAWQNLGTFNSGTSTVSFTNANATIANTTNFFNVTVASGAGLTPQAGTILRVAGSMDLQGTGVLRAASFSNTIEFNGTNQAVINPNGAVPGYYHLILSGSGTKTLPASPLTIAGDFSMAGTSSAIAGAAMTVAGNFTIGSGTSFTGGGFTHIISKNWSNGGTFVAAGSTIHFNGAVASNISASNFNNITISGAGTKNVLGTISATGNYTQTAGTFSFSSPVSNSITIGGNYTQSGGVFDFNTATSGNSSMFLGGNFTQTSGLESMTTSGAGALNGVITFNGTGIQTLSVANPGGPVWVVFSVPAGNSVQLLSNIALNSANGVTQAGFQGEIRVNGTFDLGTSTVSQLGGVAGTAVFTVNSGAKLITSNSGGVSGSVSSVNMTSTFSSGANYEFRGASTGTFTTTPVANTVNNLIVNGSASVSLTNSLTVAGKLSLTSGMLTLGANTLTIAGSSPERTTGTMNAANAGSTLAFSNAAAIILPPSIFTGNVNNLTIMGAGGITASSDFALNGVLNLQSANPLASKGILDMWDGSAMKTLTMGPSAITTGLGDVTGIVQRSSFLANTPYSFGNQFTTLTFSSGGILPASIGVKITLGSVPLWKADAIQRSYDIIHSGGSALGVSMKLHYLVSELNGNNESDLFSWDYQASPGPVMLEKHARTAYNTSEKWVESAIPDIGHFGTTYDTHLWTLARSVYVTFEGTRGWRMITSPTRTTSADLLTGFISQGVPGSTYPDKQPNFLWFDETDTLTTNMSWRTSPFNAELVPGCGYYLYVFDSVSGIYSDTLPRQMSSFGNAYFQGSFTFSGMNHPVTFTPRAGGQISQSPNDTIFYDTNIDDQGWNLLGNPTVSTLNWDASNGWTKTNLDNTIYIWDPAANQFKVWNGINGTLENGLISPFQAFWVKANNQNPALGFTDEALTTGGTFYGGTSVKSTHAGSAPSVLNLKANAAGLESNIMISFKDDGKAGPDRWDAYRLEPLSNSWLELFTLSSPAHTMPLVINNLPLDGPDVINLPLYIDGQINGHQLAGTYTLGWDLPVDWPSDWAISLHDHATRKAISMQRNNLYSFVIGNTKSTSDQPNAGTDTVQGKQVPLLPFSIVDPVATGSKLKSASQLPPFSIVIQKGVYQVDPVYLSPEANLMQNYPNPFIGQTTIRFSLPVPAFVTLSVVDIYGHLLDVVADRHFETGIYNLPWNSSNAKPGVYLLQMNADGLKKTKKLVILSR